MAATRYGGRLWRGWLGEPLALAAAKSRITISPGARVRAKSFAPYSVKKSLGAPQDEAATLACCELNSIKKQGKKRLLL